MSLFDDVRYGLRMFGRNPGLTVVVILTLAVGIGANTTVFTLVNAVLFRSLPFKDGHRIMYVGCDDTQKSKQDIGISYPDFRDWKKQSKTFQELAAYQPQVMNVSDGERLPERYEGARMTANSLSLLGQKPILGRDFTDQEGEAGAVPVVLLGYGIWNVRYGGDPNILGRSIRINEVPTTVIGVMPEGLKFPMNADLWLVLTPAAELEKRDARDIEVFALLAPERSREQAQTEMAVISRQLAAEYSKTNAGISAWVKTFNEEFNGGRIRVAFLALLGAVGFVLLIACANVANLLLARSVARTREMSIRAALGANRGRMIRQLLVESVLLAVAGGVSGVFLAMWGVRTFDLAVANTGKPSWIQFVMDYTVFGYVAGICLLTGILFGLAPALNCSKLDLHETLKEGARGSAGGARSRRLSGALVVTEIALALVLLVGAGLMNRSFLKAYGIDIGINPKNLLTMRLTLSNKKYASPEARLAFFEQLLPRLAAVPGVESAAVASSPPAQGAFRWQFLLDGQPPVEEAKRPVTGALVVNPAYFRTVGVRPLRGRDFEEADGQPGKPFVIVNQSFAARYWPRQDPLGKRIHIFRDHWPEWVTVVGVTPNIRQRDPSRPELDPVVYVPYRQEPLRSGTIVVRARIAPSALASDLRKEVSKMERDLPVYAVLTMEELLTQQRWAWRVFGSLFAIFAGIALLLSAVGIYALMSYSVSQRTQEIGVRMALGAGTGKVLLLVLKSGLRQLALGIVIGLAGALAVSRTIASLLIQITPTDPVTFTTVSALLIAVAVTACLIPARRAMKVDPVIALRYE